MTIINGYQVYVSIAMSEDSQCIPSLQRIHVESHPFSRKDECTNPVMTSNSKCCVQLILLKDKFKKGNFLQFTVHYYIKTLRRRD